MNWFIVVCVVVFVRRDGFFGIGEGGVDLVLFG